MGRKVYRRGGHSEGISGVYLVPSPSDPEFPASPMEHPPQCELRVDSLTHRGLVPTQALGSGAEARLHSVVLAPGHACGQGQ